MSRRMSRRGPVRRVGESVYGLLLLVQAWLMGAVAAALLMAGAWTSLDAMRRVVADRGGVRGMMTVDECDGWTCTGLFTPADGGGAGERPEVVLDALVSHDRGEALPVVLWPGTGEVLRTGLPGILHAWLPFAGALLLASLVIAGGLHMRRTAWASGLLGLALVGAAFAVL
ncbi:hypothetical protein CUT44_11765 [Streptomyces carminius]|uniref:Uncharacterized protein n=1 Tax=Streptomyces carminius TaxID=2665496 RepID=A0A2M8LYM8_9ACTN|nr:hypothetical protein [Streptomyces carminius]PJE97078.1 hypothetical protein CUT44_15020 [Streptomyces carminius]PJE97787.1 hypothetical protein CUT44_11765 [Streptomyces carminius]